MWKIFAENFILWNIFLKDFLNHFVDYIQKNIFVKYSLEHYCGSFCDTFLWNICKILLWNIFAENFILWNIFLKYFLNHFVDYFQKHFVDHFVEKLYYMNCFCQSNFNIFQNYFCESQNVSQNVSQKKSQNVSQNYPRNNPQNILQNIPQNVPQNYPQKLDLGKLSKKTTKHMDNSISQWGGQRGSFSICYQGRFKMHRKSF